MNEHDRPVEGATTRRRPRPRRELIAGALAVAVTLLTAGAAVWVNVGASSPDVPSRAGNADRAELVADTPHPAPPDATDDSRVTGSLAARPHDDRDDVGHDDGHDDDSGGEQDDD